MTKKEEGAMLEAKLKEMNGIALRVRNSLVLIDNRVSLMKSAVHMLESDMAFIKRYIESIHNELQNGWDDE